MTTILTGQTMGICIMDNLSILPFLICWQCFIESIFDYVAMVNMSLSSWVGIICTLGTL